MSFLLTESQHSISMTSHCETHTGRNAPGAWGSATLAGSSGITSTSCSGISRCLNLTSWTTTMPSSHCTNPTDPYHLTRLVSISPTRTAPSLAHHLHHHRPHHLVHRPVSNHLPTPSITPRRRHRGSRTRRLAG
jgi:hypothetical protein